MSEKSNIINMIENKTNEKNESNIVKRKRGRPKKNVVGIIQKVSAPDKSFEEAEQTIDAEKTKNKLKIRTKQIKKRKIDTVEIEVDKKKLTNVSTLKVFSSHIKDESNILQVL